VLLQDPLSLQQSTALPSPHYRKRSLGALRTSSKASVSPLYAAKRLPRTPATAKSAHPGYQTFTEFTLQSKGSRANTSEGNLAMGRRRSSPEVNKGLAAVLSLCEDFCDLPRPRE